MMSRSHFKLFLFLLFIIQGDWIPNEFGGETNLQAISLLQELNWVIHREFPGVFTMAEESTAWPGVTDQAKGKTIIRMLHSSNGVDVFKLNSLFTLLTH